MLKEIIGRKRRRAGSACLFMDLSVDYEYQKNLFPNGHLIQEMGRFFTCRKGKLFLIKLWNDTTLETMIKQNFNHVKVDNQDF